MLGNAVLVTTVVLLSLALAACDWYQPGFNATNDGFSPTETAVSTTNVATLTKAWEHDSLAVPNAVGPRLAVADGRVFSSDSQGVLSIDVGTGTLNWAASAPPDTATLCEFGSAGTTATGLGSPTVANGVVYVGSQDGKLLAFDAAGTSGCSGSPVVCTPLLSVDIGGAPGASRPVPANGSVFIGALHADGNEAVYKFSLPG